MRGTTIRGWVLVAAGVLTAAACGDKRNVKGGDGADYRAMVVERSSVTLNQEYSARLQGRQIVDVRPQVQGTITQILIGEGERVRKGQTLFVIDQTPYKAALQVAEANVRTAEARLATAELTARNSRELNKRHVVGEFEAEAAENALGEARAALQLAKAQEMSARNNLSYTVVRSPVSGSASMIPWHVGSLVSSTISEPLVRVADDSRVYAYFSVTERQVIDLIGRYGSLERFMAQQTPVGLRLATKSEYPIAGRIDAVSGTVDSQTGAVTLRAVFDNPDGMLRDGGTATVVVPQRMEQCVVVPQEATFELQNRVFAYKVVDGRTKSQPIEVFRLNNGRQFVVESGLEPGDTIVAEGAGLLKEGIVVVKSGVRIKN